MIIRSLAPGDDRSAFRSGNIDLDRFFQRFAGQNQFRHYVGVTYVAVDGESLLRYVFSLAHEMASRIGCVGVVVDAKSEAVPFYERFGFEALDVEAGRLGDRPVPMPMFLELGAISKPRKAKP